MEFEKTSEREETIAAKIVDAAYFVHKALGPGLLEKVYEVCFCHELTKRGLSYQRQVDIPIEYDGLTFDEGLRFDVMVEELVICEIKAVDKMNPVWEAQLLSYLKLTGKRIGFLINFNVPLAKTVLRDLFYSLGVFVPWWQKGKEPKNNAVAVAKDSPLLRRKEISLSAESLSSSKTKIWRNFTTFTIPASTEPPGRLLQIAKNQFH